MRKIVHIIQLPPSNMSDCISYLVQIKRISALKDLDHPVGIDDLSVDDLSDLSVDDLLEV